MLNLKQITTMALIGTAVLCCSSVSAAESCIHHSVLSGVLYNGICATCFDTSAGSGMDLGCKETKRFCAVSIDRSGRDFSVNNGKGTQGEMCVFCLDDKEVGEIDPGCTADKPDCMSRNLCQRLSCGEGKYFLHSECTPCPANATCDGRIFTCNDGFSKKDNVCNQLVCETNEYVINGNCKSCPANATCDGKTFTCKAGFSKKDNTCVSNQATCKPDQYMTNGGCRACPKGAKCDGKNANCPYGYTKDAVKGYITCKAAPKCSATQYLVNNKCTTCPKNATCNGKTATCKKGYNATTKNGVVTCSVKRCTQGSHESHAWIKKRYKNCTNCKVENIKAGACAKNKKAHKHYSCDCDC